MNFSKMQKYKIFERPLILKTIKNTNFVVFRIPVEARSDKYL